MTTQTYYSSFFPDSSGTGTKGSTVPVVTTGAVQIIVGNISDLSTVAANAATTSTWAGTTNRPANLAALAGDESFLNDDLTLGSDGFLRRVGGVSRGRVTISGLGYTGALNATVNQSDATTNTAIATAATTATWTGTSNRPANLAALAGNESFLNDDLTLGNDGFLRRVGGVSRGQVTIGGLGYTGALNATVGGQFGVNLLDGSGASATDAAYKTSQGTAYDVSYINGEGSAALRGRVSAAATTSAWTGTTNRPANLAALAGNESFLNDDLTLSGDGFLRRVGGVSRGQVTIGGLGYTGALNATVNQSDATTNTAIATAATTATYAGVSGIPFSQLTQNYFPVQDWIFNGTVNTSRISPNLRPGGSTTTNIIVNGTGPGGAIEPCLHMVADAGYDQQGGFDCAYFNTTRGFDPYAAYRFTIWVYQVSHSTADGALWFGTGGENGLIQADTGAANTNPYFWVSNLPTFNKWYLVVGHVHPAGSGYGNSGLSGLYDPVTGARVQVGNDFRNDARNTQLIIRAYQYYMRSGDEAYFARPMLERIGPNTASIASLMGAAALLNSNQQWTDVGNVPARLGPSTTYGAAYLDTRNIAYPTGYTVDQLKPAEAGANVTETRTSYDVSYVNGEGSAALRGRVTTAATTSTWAGTSNRPANLASLAGNESFLNDDLTLSGDGFLRRVGGVSRGQVTIGGLGYTGALNATANQTDAVTNSAIAIAATTSTWAGTTGTGTGKPADYATVGANSSNLVVTLGGGNLLQNSSFDIGTALYVGWTAYNNSGSAEPTSYSFVSGRRGGQAVQVYCSGSTSSPKGIYLDNINANIFRTGVTYVWSFYAKTNAGWNSLGKSMQITWNHSPATGGGSQVTISNPGLTVDWQRYVFKLYWAPGAAIDPNGFIYVNAIGTSGILVIIDDMQVEEGDFVTAYSAIAPTDAGQLYYASGVSVDSLKPAAAGADVTANNTAYDVSYINGEGAAALRGRVTSAANTADFPSITSVPARLGAHPYWGGTYLDANLIAYAGPAGNVVGALKPQEAGANVTENRTAADFAGRGVLARKDRIVLQAAEGGLTNQANDTWLLDAHIVTAQGTAANTTNVSTIPANNVATRVGRIDDSGYIQASGIYKPGIDFLHNVWPAELGANVTETRIAAGSNALGGVPASTTHGNITTAGTTSTWAGTTGGGKPFDNADVTALSQVVVTKPIDQVYTADYLGAIPGGLSPCSVRVTRGGTSIKLDNGTTYVATLNGGITGSIDNTNGSATKGDFTPVTFTANSASVDVVVTVGGIAQPKVIIVFTKNLGTPPASGGAGSKTANAAATNCSYTSFTAITATMTVALASGESLFGTAALDYDLTSTASGSRTASAKWQYSVAGAGVWNDFAGAVTGSAASGAYYVGGEYIDPVSGHVNVNQTIGGLSAGNYDVQVVAALNANGRTVQYSGTCYLGAHT